MTEPDGGVVVVGGSLAALRFAEAASRAGYLGPVTVVGEEPYLPYNRPPLSKAALHGRADHEALAFPLRASVADVRWRTGVKIVAADLATRAVTASDGERIGFSTLVVATGLTARRNLHDPDGEHRVLGVRTLEDAQRLAAQLRPGQSVVIVGAGFIGCEVAATARLLGCEVTVVCPHPLPLLGQLHAELAQRMYAEHVDQGVVFARSSTVAELRRGPGRSLGVILSSGVTLDADVVVEAVGSEFCTGWLDKTGLDVRNGVLTDNRMRALRLDGSVANGVFAIGDVARFPNPRFDDVPRAVGHWNMPTETARRAAQVMVLNGSVGTDQDELGSFRPVPSFWSDQYDLHLLAYGLVGLATSSRVAHGSLNAECVVEYHRGDELVAVCGLGMRSTVMSYRDHLGRTQAPPHK